MAISAAAAAAIGAALSAAGVIGNAAISSNAQKKAQERDYQGNLELAKYNNDYNYNMWKEMMEYDSPENQRKRFEAAGLNPNYQSIDSGNVSNAPTSQLPTNLYNRQAGVMARSQIRLQAINGVASQVSQLISNVSNIAGIPQNIPAARKIVGDILAKDNTLKYDKHVQNLINNLYDAYTKLGIDTTGADVSLLGLYEEGLGYRQNLVSFEDSPLAQKIGLTNANLQLQSELRDLQIQLNQFDLDNLKPQEERLLNARIALICNQAGLTAKQSRWFAAQAISKIGAMSVGSLLSLAKVL